MNKYIIVATLLLAVGCKKKEETVKEPPASMEMLKLRFTPPSQEVAFTTFVRDVDEWVAEPYWGPGDTVGLSTVLAICAYGIYLIVGGIYELRIFYGPIAIWRGLVYIAGLFRRRNRIPKAKVV